MLLVNKLAFDVGEKPIISSTTVWYFKSYQEISAY